MLPARPRAPRSVPARRPGGRLLSGLVSEHWRAASNEQRPSRASVDSHVLISSEREQLVQEQANVNGVEPEYELSGSEGGARAVGDLDLGARHWIRT